MNFRRIAYLAIFALMLPLTGCFAGRSHIHATDGRSYQVYADGALICEDSQECKIGTRGTPKRLELELVKNGRVVGSKTVNREITGASIFWGFFTYFTSLYLYQAYPNDIYIPINYNNERNYSNSENNSASWDDTPYKNAGSVWDKSPSTPDAVTAPANTESDEPAGDNEY